MAKSGPRQSRFFAPSTDVCDVSTERYIEICKHIGELGTSINIALEGAEPQFHFIITHFDLTKNWPFSISTEFKGVLERLIDSTCSFRCELEAFQLVNQDRNDNEHDVDAAIFEKAVRTGIVAAGEAERQTDWHDTLVRLIGLLEEFENLTRLGRSAIGVEADGPQRVARRVAIERILECLACQYAEAGRDFEKVTLGVKSPITIFLRAVGLGGNGTIESDVRFFQNVRRELKERKNLHDKTTN